VTKHLFLAVSLAIVGMFVTGARAEAGGPHGGHYGHGHSNYGGWHGGHVQHVQPGHWHGGGYGYSVRQYYYPPAVVYRPAPVYPVYPYGYYPSPSTSLYIGGRNFSFGISGF
jgi:hypothetical protein